MFVNKILCNECQYEINYHDELKYHGLCLECYVKLFEGVKPKVNDEEDFVLGSEVAVATPVQHNDVKYTKLGDDWVLGSVETKHTVHNLKLNNFVSIPQAKMILNNDEHEVLRINSNGEIEIDGEITEDYEKVGKAFVEWASQYKAN